jgi:hypothetical protein
MLGEIRMGGLANTSSIGLKEVLSIQMKGSIVNTVVRIKRTYRAVRDATERSFITPPSLHSERCWSPPVL